MLTLYTAILSEQCLAILLKDTPKYFFLGQLLGINDGILEALQSFFKCNPQLLLSHTMGMWLMKDQHDPLTQLSEALIVVGDKKTATKIQLLSYLSKQNI